MVAILGTAFLFAFVIGLVFVVSVADIFSGIGFGGWWGK